ncbi:two-component sensor histidine kinase [Paenibacillus sp. 19GGS1-52]|uniref:sensor histidine kinase n=1 Tax=Paenibacillus sp. 19GGS1-52 TaxID=2758563 RepID=UPI001EFAC208|nr:histidine kinase [Paenibacillus sp. 19GGS1-52]ULO05530.1 two-component sensor histidine kinase [Paenibacillus sp. 19GGS1-52]
MILLIPTLMVGIWEILRHQLLMPYLSMNMGNYLTPILVFVFTIVLLVPLFSIMERNQQELERERAAKHAMEAREGLARSLHDGIAQSLFLLSVKIDRLEQNRRNGEVSEESVHQIQKTVHEVNHYVRQAIADLKVPFSDPQTLSLEQSVQAQLAGIANEVMIEVSLDWSLPDDIFTPLEKVELLSCIREAIINVRKHTRAAKVSIFGNGDKKQWRVAVVDNGGGFVQDPYSVSGSYGLQIMQDRTEQMGWKLQLESGSAGTLVEITKGGSS